MRDVALTTRSRPPRPALDVLAPAVAFLAGQALTLAAVAAVAAASGWRLWSLMQSWDAQHLVAVARSGYPATPGAPAAFAFFPGVPLLVRLVAAATGLAPEVCGVAVSVAAGVVLAYGVDRLAAEAMAATPPGRLAAVVLVGTLPLSVVFLMPYTEATFCALAVWALVALGRGRWLTAGLLCAAAGLVRPTGVALVLAVAVAAGGRWLAGPDRARAAAVVLAPLGILAYLGWLTLATGSPRAWIDGESQGWNTAFDGGAYTWSWIRTIAVGGPATMDLFILAAGGACSATVLVLVRRRIPAGAAYVAGVLAVALGTSGVWNSKYRLQLPALVIACVVAAPALARLPAPYRSIVLAVLAGVGCWFSAFALTRYPYAI